MVFASDRDFPLPQGDWVCRNDDHRLLEVPLNRILLLTADSSEGSSSLGQFIHQSLWNILITTVTCQQP